MEAIGRFKRQGVDGSTLHTRALDLLNDHSALEEFHQGTAVPSLASNSSDEDQVEAGEGFQGLIQLKQSVIETPDSPVKGITQ